VQGSTASRTSAGSVATHPLESRDDAFTLAFRAMVVHQGCTAPGSKTRGQFDAFRESVLRAMTVTSKRTPSAHTGVWVHPPTAGGLGDRPCTWLVQLWIRQGIAISSGTWCESGARGHRTMACRKTPFPGRTTTCCHAIGACPSGVSPDRPYGRCDGESRTGRSSRASPV